MNAHNQQQGFTLIELAMVLLIVGLLSAGGIRLLSTTFEQQRYQQTQQDMNDIKEALITYYTQFGRLPCPDHEHFPNNSDHGVEKPVIPNGTCSNSKGWLPHVTIGIGANGDAWGQRYRYMLHPIFTKLTTSPLAACSIDNLTNSRANSYNNDNIIIQNLQATPINISEWSGFVIVSTGKNGAITNANIGTTNGAFTASGGCLNTDTLEQENCDNDNTLRSGLIQSDGQVIVYDDLVNWVSDLQLIAAARKAGRCSGS